MTRHIAPRSRRLNRCIGGLVALVAFASLTWSNAAHPADDGAVPPEEMTREDAFEWSNRIAETWLVDQRCGILTRAQREEYQWHARQISRWIARLVPPEELADLTLAGVPTPLPELARCGAAAQIYLNAALHDARDYSEYLTRERYRPGQIVQRIDLRRYALIEVAAMVNLRCGHLSRRHRDELTDRRRAIRLQISETTTDDRIKFVMEREIDAYFDKAAPCGRQTRQFVIAALKEARDMTKETWAR